MHWNFRIIRTKVQGRDVFQIHRVFYESDLKRKPVIIENAPASITGVERRAMIEDVELMCNAFDASVIYIPEWSKG